MAIGAYQDAASQFQTNVKGGISFETSGVVLALDFVSQEDLLTDLDPGARLY